MAFIIINMNTYELSKDELKKIQMIQLEMLVEVDRICKKCGIKYNIIAGTLLGAVRHGGYIPWDDDADVAFLRPEYEKFREACKTELDTTRFYFQDHRNTDGYRWGYGKIRRKNTIFLRENQEMMPYEQGIFIDIFPLDTVPGFYPLRAINNFHCFIIRKALWSEVGQYTEKNFIIKRIYCIINRIPREKIFKHYNKMRDFWNGNLYNRKDYSRFEKRKWVRILTFPTPNKQYGYKKKWYEESSKYLFENIEFNGIKEADDYLSFKFGDYMKLPPEDQRKVHPITKLKLI